MIRLTIPSIEKDDLKAVSEVLNSGYLVQGSWVARFESEVANYVGCKYAVAVSSCTAALHLALLAISVSPGDLVIVSSYSWPATANVVELCRAQPVFVDIQPDSFNIDPDRLENTLIKLMVNPETAKRVKAIIPVHTFGQLANMSSILEIAERYQIPVVEDAACALGATLNSKNAGSWGIMGCFSFHPRKAITTGEGGMITTNDPNLVRKLRALRNHGIDPDIPTTDFILPGFNYRITEFQAALGITQMRKLERIIIRRRRSAAYYNYLLKDTNLQQPIVSNGNKHIYQSYVIMLPQKIASKRDEIIAHLRNFGIETSIGTWNIPLTTYFRSRYGYKNEDFPVVDHVFKRSLTLPLYEGILETDQETVVNCLIQKINNYEDAK